MSLSRCYLSRDKQIQIRREIACASSTELGALQRRGEKFVADAELSANRSRTWAVIDMDMCVAHVAYKLSFDR